MSSYDYMCVSHEHTAILLLHMCVLIPLILLLLVVLVVLVLHTSYDTHTTATTGTTATYLILDSSYYSHKPQVGERYLYY